MIVSFSCPLFLFFSGFSFTKIDENLKFIFLPIKLKHSERRAIGIIPTVKYTNTCSRKFWFLLYNKKNPDFVLFFWIWNPDFSAFRIPATLSHYFCPCLGQCGIRGLSSLSLYLIEEHIQIMLHVSRNFVPTPLTVTHYL